jgi:hypothetical protein
MRGLRGVARFVSLVLLTFTIAGSALAQLLVATPADVADSVAHAELAYAVGDGPPVTWVSLRVRRARLALVAALPEGASADVALDAWLSALETSASPRVLLPRDTTDCGETSFVEVTWPRSAGAVPDELRLESAEDVASVLAEQGLLVSGELPSASAYVVWSWPRLTTAQTTRTLRVRGGATPLSFLPGSPFPILVNAVTRGAARYAGEVDCSDLEVTFIAGPGKRSDYRARVESWLAGRADPLLETRSRGLLYDWSIHSDLVSLAPLIRTYAARAALELPELDERACGNALAALRLTASEPNRELEVCGSARDAALALQAAEPELSTLQRFVVSGAQGVSAESLLGGGEPRAPTVRAKLLDAAACPNVQQPPEVVDPGLSGGGPGPISEPRGEGEVIVEETVVVEQHQPVEVDCTGSPQPEPDAGYDDDDDIDCSSDTSSSSDSRDSEVDCSSDTSTASEPESDDAGCSDDTSSPSSDDSSCDGGPSEGSEDDGGYDGDTCASVSATPRATQKSQAGLTRGKRLKGSRRLKTSLWSVAFAALALPIRRRKRGARAVS